MVKRIAAVRRYRPEIERGNDTSNASGCGRHCPYDQFERGDDPVCGI